MTPQRRDFLKLAVLGSPVAATRGAWASSTVEASDSFGVLVDIPNCIGCRKCEFACQRAAGFETPPIESFDDKSAFASHRRPSPFSYTTVNRFDNPVDSSHPIHVKANCLHCLEPACASACLVGAIQKQPSGAVTYDAWKCMGCRYCMVACPFGIPAYDYHDALTPRVRKCDFCADRIAEGDVPACVRICPNEAMTFGKRAELLRIAHRRIEERPERYVNHVYGEHEAGGTAWLYLSSVPFESLKLPGVQSAAATGLTETLQHAVFKHWVPPFVLYGFLGLMMWLTKRESGAPVEWVGGPIHMDGARDGRRRVNGEGLGELTRARSTSDANPSETSEAIR